MTSTLPFLSPGVAPVRKRLLRYAPVHLRLLRMSGLDIGVGLVELLDVGKSSIVNMFHRGSAVLSPDDNPITPRRRGSPPRTVTRFTMTRRRQAQTFVARVASGFPLHSRLRICCVGASAFQQQQYEGTAVEVLHPSALYLMLDAHDPTGCCGRLAGRGGWARAPEGYAIRFTFNETDLVPRESSHTRSKLLYPMTLTLRSRSRYQRCLWHYTNAVLYLFIVYLPSGGTDGRINQLEYVSAVTVRTCSEGRWSIRSDWVKTVFGAIQ
ncbi:hypothetical protein EDB83DRAFT_2315380 [Lactarius deliciosus]|nr:hypothetical protein EDB83DRAFT_2315380 [Lactarius deliciosus]